MSTHTHLNCRFYTPISYIPELEWLGSGPIYFPWTRNTRRGMYIRYLPSLVTTSIVIPPNIYDLFRHNWDLAIREAHDDYAANVPFYLSHSFPLRTYRRKKKMHSFILITINTMGPRWLIYPILSYFSHSSLGSCHWHFPLGCSTFNIENNIAIPSYFVRPCKRKDILVKPRGRFIT